MTYNKDAPLTFHSLNTLNEYYIKYKSMLSVDNP